MKRYTTMLIAVLLMVSMTACDNNTTSNDNDDSGNNYSYVLVETGQIECYNADGEVIATPQEGDAFYGQDGNYQIGEPFSYVDNGDETISDMNTGLMWQKIPVTEGFSYDDAVEYVENLELAGYDDWRMPASKELYSISNFCTGWPYIDTSYFDLSFEEITKDEQYWSSDEYVGVTVEGGNEAAFGVNHVTGHIKAYAAGGEMPPPLENGDSKNHPVETRDGESGPANPFNKQVRAVRGDYYGINEFSDNSDGTITDIATGLMWSTLDNAEAIDWENALGYADDSELAGYSDWRLPNVKELQSIVDYSYAPGAPDASKDRAAIDPLFTCTPTINEAGTDDYGYYWTGTSALFEEGGKYYYAWYVAFGRAVDGDGNDFHGAGAVRFDTKEEGGPAGEGGERYYNYVRLVRNSD